jgi:hypothetical protein
MKSPINGKRAGLVWMSSSRLRTASPSTWREVSNWISVVAGESCATGACVAGSTLRPGTVGVLRSTCTTALASYFGVASSTYSTLATKNSTVPNRIRRL